MSKHFSKKKKTKTVLSQGVYKFHVQLAAIILRPTMPHFLRLLKCLKFGARRFTGEEACRFAEPSATKIGKVYGVLMLKYLHWRPAKQRRRRLFLHRRNRFSPLEHRAIANRTVRVSSFQSPFAL